MKYAVEKGTTHLFQLYKPGYLPFACKIGPIQSDSFLVRVSPVKFYGEVSAFTGNDSSTISIDGRASAKGRVTSMHLSPGEHEVRVFDPAFGKAVSSSFEVQPLRHVLLESEYNVIYTPRLLMSIVIPGRTTRL